MNTIYDVDVLIIQILYYTSPALWEPADDPRYHYSIQTHLVS